MGNRTYGRSAPAKDFSDVPRANIERSTFDRSHGHKTTMNAGFVTPIFLDEVLPGDTFDLKTSAFGRLATPIFPLMDNVNFSTQSECLFHWEGLACSFLIGRHALILNCCY